MKLYFVSKDKNNKKIKGRVDAIDKNDLKNTLISNGLYPSLILKDYYLLSSKLKDKVLLEFIQDWYSLECSNIKTQDSLEIIKDNTNNKHLRNVLQLIIIRTNQGFDIIDSFMLHKNYFPEIFLEMLKIGFVKDNIKNSLSLLKEYYTDLLDKTNKISSAMVYPKILLVTIFLAIIVVSKFVVPNFDNLYKEMNVELPKFTKIIFTVMLFIGNNLIYILLGLLLLLFTLLLFKRTNFYSKLKGNFMYKFFLTKDLVRAQNTYLFCKSCEILWESNYNKIDSIDIIKEILPNKIYQDSMNWVKKDIQDGLLVGEAIQKTKLFDSNLSNMLIIGEKTNALLINLKNACIWYSFELKNKTNKLIKLVEPLMIALMAIFIFVIILIIFVPMITSLKGVM